MVNYVPLFLLLLAFPVAVAGQNITVSLAFLVALYGLYARRQNVTWVLISNQGWRFWSLVLFFGWMVLATCLAPDNPVDHIGSYLWGCLPFILFPALFRWNSSPVPKSVRDSLLKFLWVVGAAWGALAVIQYVGAWHFQGARVVSGVARAQGFYSHPLTLAYAALLLWPAAIASVLVRRYRGKAWSFFAGVLAMLWTTESRTVQVVALLVGITSILLFGSNKSRGATLKVLILAVFIAGVTDNPVRRKFRNTFQGVEDRQSAAYADDRLAFWDAHWQLVKERPWLGHGLDIAKAKRDQAYISIGLADFKKKYPAHNTYLEILVEGGVVGLILFLAWVASYVGPLIKQMRRHRLAFFEFQTWVAFLIASLTQNSFQDSEVRYGVMLLCIYRWVFADDEASSLRRS